MDTLSNDPEACKHRASTMRLEGPIEEDSIRAGDWLTWGTCASVFQAKESPDGKSRSVPHTGTVVEVGSGRARAPHLPAPIRLAGRTYRATFKGSEPTPTEPAPAPAPCPVPAPEGRLIAFAGVAGSGKSLASEYLVGMGWRRVKFADPLKAMLRSFYASQGLEEPAIAARIGGHLKEKPDPLLCGKTPRHAMQTLGTEWGRDEIDPNFWVRAWYRQAKALMGAGYDVVADDLRFDNEALAVSLLGGTTVRITRPTGGKVDIHPSEKIDFNTDESIYNNGQPRDLFDAIDAILDGSP